MLELLVHNLVVASSTTALLMLTLACLHLGERRISGLLARRVGWRASLYPTAIIGVPLHELSHLVAALLFRHRIVGYSLFEPDPATGTLGYVRHGYRRRNVWQLAGTFFIGISPFFAGASVLAATLVWMMPQEAQQQWLQQVLAVLTSTASDGLESGRALRDGAELALLGLQNVFAGPSAWLPLQLYLVVAVASHMAPSFRDLRGGLLGGSLLALLLAASASLLSFAELNAAPFLTMLALVAAVALVAILFQSAYAMVVLILIRVFQKS